ncbi:hypothetical protein HRbin21_00680 [bacterium HR21]|jgi:hypothetical protein|nr:hypothetical protein HRbin21_00680 [bacterium HR21]
MRHLLALLLLIGLGTAAQAQTSLGIGLCYGSKIKKPGLDARVIHGFSPTLRGALDFEYFFTESGHTFWTLDGNAHYIFYEQRRQGQRLYGLFGLQYAQESLDLGFTTASNSEIGLNLGIGGELRLDFGAAFGELKLVLGNYDQLVLLAGLRFGLGGR